MRAPRTRLVFAPSCVALAALVLAAGVLLIAPSARAQQNGPGDGGVPDGGEGAGGEGEHPTPTLVPPRIAEFVEAEYPAEAREAGIEGAVELESRLRPTARSPTPAS